MRRTWGSPTRLAGDSMKHPRRLSAIPKGRSPPDDRGQLVSGLLRGILFPSICRGRRSRRPQRRRCGPRRSTRGCGIPPARPLPRRRPRASSSRAPRRRAPRRPQGCPRAAPPAARRRGAEVERSYWSWRPANSGPTASQASLNSFTLLRRRPRRADIARDRFGDTGGEQILVGRRQLDESAASERLELGDDLRVERRAERQVQGCAHAVRGHHAAGAREAFVVGLGADDEPLQNVDGGDHPAQRGTHRGTL